MGLTVKALAHWLTTRGAAVVQRVEQIVVYQSLFQSACQNVLGRDIEPRVAPSASTGV